MFPTLLLFFILCTTKRYSGEEAANMIVDGLLSDEDNKFSNESHLSFDLYFESIYSGSFSENLTCFVFLKHPF